MCRKELRLLFLSLSLSLVRNTQCFKVFIHLFALFGDGQFGIFTKENKFSRSDKRGYQLFWRFHNTLSLSLSLFLFSFLSFFSLLLFDPTNLTQGKSEMTLWLENKELSKLCWLISALNCFLFQHLSLLPSCCCSLKNEPTRPLFVYFCSFQTKNTIFTTNQCEKMSKCSSSIRCRDSNLTNMSRHP